MNWHEATLEQCRDFLAERKGWTRTVPYRNEAVPLGSKWHRPTNSGTPGSITWCYHPIDDTLDSIASSLLEGWVWDYIRCRHYPQAPWYAKATKHTCKDQWADADTELLARARCACLAWAARGK